MVIRNRQNEYEINENIKKMIKMMKKYEDKFLIKNWLAAIAKICKKLLIKIKKGCALKKITKYLATVIYHENDIDILKNSLIILNLTKKINYKILKKTGCLSKLISLLKS